MVEPSDHDAERPSQAALLHRFPQCNSSYASWCLPPVLHVGYLAATAQSQVYPHPDLESAYHQIPLARKARPIMTFRVQGMRLFQFTRMPYGLAYAPATFHRSGNRARAGALCVLVPGRHNHRYRNVRRTQLVLERLVDAGLTMNHWYFGFDKFDILVSRCTVTWESKIFIIYNFEILHDLKYLVSKPRMSIVDFNFQVSRLNFGPPPPPPSFLYFNTFEYIVARYEEKPT